MKSTTTTRILALLVWAITITNAHLCDAQRWRKVLDFPEQSGIQETVILPSGDIISLINTDSIFLVALDQNGTLKWHKNIGQGTGLALELIDNYLFVSGKTGETFSSNAAILFKFNQNGSLVWQKSYERGFISAITKQGNGYLLGGNFDQTGSSSNAVLYKVDANGVVEWMKEYDVYSNSGVTAIVEVGTALYLVIDASTVGVGFEGSVLIKANTANGEMIWRRDKSLGRYDNFPDEYDLLRPMDVKLDTANKIVISAPTNATGGLIYSYSLDGVLTSEVAVDLTLPHALQILENGDYMIAGILAETPEGTNAVIERRTPAGSVIWQRTIGQGSFITMEVYGDTIIAAGTDQDFRSTSSYHPYIVRMTTDGRVYESVIRFDIAEDLNENCLKDAPDQSLEDILLRIDDRFFSSGLDGTVMVDLDTGWYDYVLDLPAYMHFCIPQQDIHIQSPDEIVYQNILVKREQCADVSVGITYTEFIQGETNSFYVQYNNSGTIGMQDVVLNIKLDARIQLEAVSTDYETTAEGIQITIPFLPPNSADRVKLDVVIDEDLLLFSTICIEVSISPHSSCDQHAQLWNGPELKMNGVCENNMVVFTVKNIGTDMTEGVPYQLFADGFRFEAGTLQLNAGQEKEYTIASGGSTISMLSRQVADYPFNTVVASSVEICGNGAKQTGSLGMVRMFDPASPSPYISRACIEVRDQYSTDRVFEISRGLGRYHFIDSTQNRCEFSLMYQNHSEETIDQLELYIKPGWQFDKLTFSELASSHPTQHEVFGTGIIKLTSQNITLLPGDQMQYRFALDLNSSGPDQDFVSLGVSGTANDSIPVTMYEGFYNRNVPFAISEISPFVSIENGTVIGRGHTWEFDGDLQVIENGTIIYAGSTYEFGVNARALVQATSSDNTILWQHTYAFKEGGSLLRKIIPAGDGRILLVGSIDDNQIPDNYINDAYACMLMLDENGQELWRRVWKPGNGTYVGGSLNNGHFYQDDKIVLLGFRYTPDGRRQFLMEIDANGEIHWMRDFVLGSDTGTPVASINTIPMKVSSAGNIFIVSIDQGYYTYIVKLDEEANILGKSRYFDTSTMGAVYINDFVILDNEELELIGYGYVYDTASNFTSFGKMIHLDIDLIVIGETKILDQYSYLELSAATIRDSVVFAAGTIMVDSTSGVDAVIVRSDLTGANARVVRIADFGASDYGNSIAMDAEGQVFASVQTQTTDDFYNLQMGFFWAKDSVTATNTIAPSPDRLQIFPNPVRDVVNIALEKNIVKSMVYAMNGSLMQIANGGDHTFTVRDFPPGQYLLVVYTSDETRHIATFVKVD